MIGRTRSVWLLNLCSFCGAIIMLHFLIFNLVISIDILWLTFNSSWADALGGVILGFWVWLFNYVSQFLILVNMLFFSFVDMQLAYSTGCGCCKPAPLPSGHALCRPYLISHSRRRCPVEASHIHWSDFTAAGLCISSCDPSPGCLSEIPVPPFSPLHTHWHILWALRKLEKTFAWANYLFSLAASVSLLFRLTNI